jgi:putative oxidoreductase
MTVALSAGLLLLRVIGGLTIAAHGAQKLFGWFEGPGFAKFAQGMRGSGLKPGWLWTALVILGELGGGLAVALGFFTPLGTAGMVGAMFMAIARAHWKNGFFNGKRGIEFPLQVLTIAVAIGVIGPGDYSLDHALGITRPVAVFLALAAVALAVDLIGLAMARQHARQSVTPPASVQPTTQPTTHA